MSLTIEGMECHLDAVVTEALRRQRNQLDIDGASKEERAARMAKVRAELKIWRERAPAAVLRAAVSSRGGVTP